MDTQSVSQLIPLLQTAIGPVILISGIGLLLLTMTNRYGRVIDRSRMLVDDLPNSTEKNRDKVVAQLQILWRRARLIRLVITLSSLSALSAAILIIVIFITALWVIELTGIIVITFIFCMTTLIASLTLFIFDINQSLGALKLEFETEGFHEG